MGHTRRWQAPGAPGQQQAVGEGFYQSTLSHPAFATSNEIGEEASYSGHQLNAWNTGGTPRNYCGINPSSFSKGKLKP